ncbi:MAG: ribonuclease Z [Gemmatimonadetes bacterium]|nr:ribonuclease Z [Gemmatimonadota bacterium]
MRLTAVGTGTAAPTADAVNPGWLVDAGELRLLLDCGSGVVHRMAALGLDWRAITHVLLTHFHADHISDLATLVTAWRWGQHPARTAPAVFIGPVGTAALFERLAGVFGSIVTEPGNFPVEVHEMPAGAEVALPGGVQVGSFKVPHTVESMAYSIRRGGCRIVYTGDTGPDAGLATWAAGADVLIAECSLPRDMRPEGHLAPDDCAALAATARPGCLVLTHRYPPLDAVDVLGLVRSTYAGRVRLAHDGWSIELGE